LPYIFSETFGSMPFVRKTLSLQLIYKVKVGAIVDQTITVSWFPTFPTTFVKARKLGAC